MPGVIFQPFFLGGSKIGTPVGLGSTIATRNGLTTLTFTTTGAIPAGALVVVGAGDITGTADPVSSISDGTNSYSKASGGVAAAACEAEIWYVANAAAVSSGATLTVTYSATLDTNCAYAAAFYVTGIVQSSPVDTAPAVTSTGTISTGTLSQGKELVVGTAVVFGSTGTLTYSEASGFTNIAALSLNSATNNAAGLGYQIVAATTSIAYAPTFTGAVTNRTNAEASFKGA